MVQLLSSEVNTFLRPLHDLGHIHALLQHFYLLHLPHLNFATIFAKILLFFYQHMLHYAT